MSNDYHDLLFPLDSPRLAPARGLSALEWGKFLLHDSPATPMLESWERLVAEPFRGTTTDGRLIPDLFSLADEGAPVEAMAQAAEALLKGLSEADRKKLCYPIDAQAWRRWSNPEILVNPNGLRLDEVSVQTRDAIMAVLGASLSAKGYDKARGCMYTNAFLGELCQLPRIMNEWSFNFLLFGKPSLTEPWGWNFYGHHLVLNCFVLGRQMVISPTFMGAEPNVIDKGEHAGLRLFDKEEVGGLALMRSLPADLRDKAVTYPDMNDPAMPEGRWHPADQRHLGGAFQDNRIIPYEGVPVTAFTSKQRDELMSVVEAFISYLPKEPLAARLRQIEARLDETWWSWIGGYGDEDPFYYRVQSPVIMVEFDHHSGVWLNNEIPAKCHIHTVVRTPNGNDYGKDLLRQHYEHVHPGHAPGRE